MTTRQEPASPVDVLIAEDDPLLRRDLRVFLEGHGYTCAEAVNGSQAVALAHQRQPRYILLDLVMPELDGVTVARRLRADPRTQSIHIHCLTGLTDARVLDQAREAGCEQVMLKPVDPATILEAVRLPVAKENWVEATSLTLIQAEELIDWLENHGCTGIEVNYQACGMKVRYRAPPGMATPPFG